MGKRKIDILPIKDERNRKVTFVKRKAGLFKKAHELAVLCQADLAVIIIGNNHKLFEYSSVDMKDLLERYQQYDKPNESKKPQDFGDYEAGSRVQGAGPETPFTKDESEDDDEDEPSRKRSRSERDEYTPSKQLGQAFMSQQRQQQQQQQSQPVPSSVSKRPHLRVKIPQDMPIKKDQSSDDSATPQKLSASNNTNITSSDTQRRDSAKSTPLSATIPNAGIFGMSQFSPSQQLPLPTRNGFPLYSATTNNNGNGNSVRPMVGGEQQTPMSALPSKYVNDLFPSPNNFYSNEWNIPFGTGNTPLPSSAQHLLPVPNGTPQWAQQGNAGGGATAQGTANTSAANSANSRFMFTRANSNYSEMLPSPLQMMMGTNNQFSQYETPAKKKPK